RGSGRFGARTAAAGVAPGHGPRAGRSRRARNGARRARRGGDRGHARPARPPARPRRTRLARGRGSFRLGPAAARPDRRSVASGPDDVGGGRTDPGAPRRGFAPRSRGPGAASRRFDRAAIVDVTPGIRREAGPDLDTLGQEDELVGRIHDEIAASGPMTFARFMELALYDPEGGYYRAAAPRPGRAGDFLTAPETH